jgi:hypothetical protein
MWRVDGGIMSVLSCCIYIFGGHAGVLAYIIHPAALHETNNHLSVYAGGGITYCHHYKFLMKNALKHSCH